MDSTIHKGVLLAAGALFACLPTLPHKICGVALLAMLCSNQHPWANLRSLKRPGEWNTGAEIPNRKGNKKSKR